MKKEIIYIEKYKHLRAYRWIAEVGESFNVLILILLYWMQYRKFFIFYLILSALNLFAMSKVYSKLEREIEQLEYELRTK